MSKKTCLCIYPTDPFIILELQTPSHDFPEPHIICRSTDLNYERFGRVAINHCRETTYYVHFHMNFVYSRGSIKTFFSGQSTTKQHFSESVENIFFLWRSISFSFALLFFLFFFMDHKKKISDIRYARKVRKQ